MTTDATLNLESVSLSLLPVGHRERHLFQVIVAYRGQAGYGIFRHGEVLGDDGEWDMEPIPSSRSDQWIAGHRFPYEEALRRAALVVPGLTVNGWTAGEVLAQANEVGPNLTGAG